MPVDGGGKDEKCLYFQNIRGDMVEANEKTCHMPKSENRHGGGKSKILLYAQIQIWHGGDLSKTL